MQASPCCDPLPPPLRLHKFQAANPAQPVLGIQASGRPRETPHTRGFGTPTKFVNDARNATKHQLGWKMVAQHISGWLGRNNTKRDCMSGWRSPTASEYRLAPWRRTLRFRKGSFRHQGSCVTELGRLCRRRPLPSALVAAKSPPKPLLERLQRHGKFGTSPMSLSMPMASVWCWRSHGQLKCGIWYRRSSPLCCACSVRLGCKSNFSHERLKPFCVCVCITKNKYRNDHGPGHSARSEWSTHTHTWVACSLRVPTVMRICANAHVHCYHSALIPQLIVRRLERRHPSNSTCSKTSESVSRRHEERSTNGSRTLTPMARNIRQMCEAHLKGRRLAPAWNMFSSALIDARSFDCCVVHREALAPHARRLDETVDSLLPLCHWQQCRVNPHDRAATETSTDSWWPSLDTNNAAISCAPSGSVPGRCPEFGMIIR